MALIVEREREGSGIFVLFLFCFCCISACTSLDDAPIVPYDDWNR